MNEKKKSENGEGEIKRKKNYETKFLNFELKICKA